MFNKRIKYIEELLKSLYEKVLVLTSERLEYRDDMNTILSSWSKSMEIANKNIEIMEKLTKCLNNNNRLENFKCNELIGTKFHIGGSNLIISQIIDENTALAIVYDDNKNVNKMETVIITLSCGEIGWMEQ